MFTRILVVVVAFSQAAVGATIIVDGGGGGDYTTIQAAVDNANPGDTIIVHPGTYVEEIIVPVSVTITGSGVGQTIVLPATSRPGSGSGSQLNTTAWLFRIRANDVTLASLTLDGDNPSLPAPIDARGGVVTDFTTGTYSGLLCTNVEVKNVKYRGLYAAAGGSGHAFIANFASNINGNVLDSVGIFLFGAEGEARDNVVSNCSIGIGFQSGGGGTIANNTIAGGDIAILCNGSAVPVNVDGNTITQSAQGIQSIAVSTTVTIANNTMQDCLSGITLFGLGTNAHVVDHNAIDGEQVAGSVGLFATTDVSPFGFGDLHLVATRNQLHRCDFGAVLDENATSNAPLLDAVFAADASLYNTFADNVSFNLFLQNCNDDVDATHNFWGAVSPAVIEQSIWHRVDDPALGLVDFSNTVNLFATVDDDGPADFPTINPAVQALLPGGTVLVRPGLYVEDVVIDRSLLITGAGTASDPSVGSVLKGASIHPDLTVVFVTASDVTLEHLRIDGEQPVYDRARRAVYALSVDGLTVRDCVIKTATSGVAYVTSTNGTFLRNEVFDFGKSLQEGGGLFMFGSTASIGLEGSGNSCHDGRATGIIYHNGSAGSAQGNLVVNAPLGYLANGCAAPTLFLRDQAADCDQGFQGIGNFSPITYTENVVLGATTGFALFGLGGAVHTYQGNQVDTKGGDQGLFATTESVFGDGDCVLVVRDTTLTGSAHYGVRLDESASSLGFLMDADLAASGTPTWITGNADQDIFLDTCNDDIAATGNYFGAADAGTIETKVYHQVDDPALGLVDFSGFAGFTPPMLRVRGILDLNFRVSFALTGTPGGLYYLLASTGTASLPTPYGLFRLDPAHLILIRTSTMPASGIATVDATMPIDPPAGIPIYFQSFVGVGAGGGLSNLQSLVTQ